MFVSYKHFQPFLRRHDTQHYAFQLNVVMLNVVIMKAIMLKTIMLNVVMLKGIMLSEMPRLSPAKLWLFTFQAYPDSSSCASEPG